MGTFGRYPNPEFVYVLSAGKSPYPTYPKRALTLRFSFGIARGICLSPVPRRLDNEFDIRVLWLPAECFERQRGVGDQLWRVACASTLYFRWNRARCDPTRGVDYIQYRETRTVPEI